MGKNVLLWKMCASVQHSQRWTIRRGCKLSVETNGAVNIYIDEELPLGSLPHVLKGSDLNSTFIACSINASAGKREKYEVIRAPKMQASCFIRLCLGADEFSFHRGGST